MDAPIHFTKKAVIKLNELHEKANLPSTALFSIDVKDKTLENELIYAFSYKGLPSEDEKLYVSNGFPYILNTNTVMHMANATIDYEKGNFIVDLDEDLLNNELAEA